METLVGRLESEGVSPCETRKGADFRGQLPPHMRETSNAPQLFVESLLFGEVADILVARKGEFFHVCHLRHAQAIISGVA